MNQSQALAKLKKVLGPKMRYRVDPKAPDLKERKSIHAAYEAASEAERVARDACTARLDHLKKWDAKYQKLLAAFKAAEHHKDSLPSAHSFRVTVGLDQTLFFSVKAQGDTWDEVVSQLCKQPERV